MLIRSEFSIDFNLPQAAAMIGLLRLFPTLDASVKAPEELRVEHLDHWSDAPTTVTQIPYTDYTDVYGNRCSRFLAPAGNLRIAGQSLIELDFVPDPINTQAVQHPVEELPTDVLQFLLSSRYCQVDSLSLVAGDLFGHTAQGWTRAIAIRDWVHNHVRFDYASARPTKTALDVFTERVGVCRDFQHLAVTMSRAMNIPARYVTGYLGDIRRPYSGAGDFSAWYEVFLDGRWYPMDARHNDGRIGRVLMAVGRDATDVAITTSFGVANLTRFYVESIEVDEQGTPIPLPGF
jgi:transglutaminase-like putative cysteine protease